MSKHKTTYYKDIHSLLQGLKTVRPISDHFHLHQFKDTPASWIEETSIFRSDTYTIILLTSGEAYYKIGLSEYHICSNSLYFMAPQQLRYYKRMGDWDGYVLVFMEDFLVEHPILQQLVHRFEGFKLSSKVVVNLDQEQANATELIFEQLYNTAYSNHPQKFDIAKALLEWLMLHSTNLYQQQHRSEDQQVSKPHRIVQAFEHLVEEHLYEITQDKADKILSIKEIAAQLNVHPSYLAEVLKEYTGKSPKDLLSERIILEAQALLHNTEMSISEIAYFLRFQDPSNFTKFFKSKTGFSPSQSRKN